MKFSQYTESSSNSDLYFKFIEGENHIRIVSDPLTIYKAFADDKSCTVYLTPDEARKNPKSKERFLFWVIDRKTNKMQIAEVGPQIMQQISVLSKTGDSKFDDLPPYDMFVKREGAGIETEYSVLASRTNTEITPDEVEKIKGLEKLIDHVMKDAVDAKEAMLMNIPF
jgi:hypothetical protein